MLFFQGSNLTFLSTSKVLLVRFFFTRKRRNLTSNFEAFLFGGSAFSGEMLSLSVACVIELEGLLNNAVILDISSNKS